MSATSPLIKICGITSPQAAQQVVACGADFIGLVFHPASKRCVDDQQAADIIAATNAGSVSVVGVFVDQDAQQIQQRCEQLSLDYAQLHGDNARLANQYLPEQIKRIYVVNVLANGGIDQDSLIGFEYFDPQRDFILFDNVAAGSGKQFDLSNFVNTLSGRFFLAGGLDADNVHAAINRVQPDGVDVSSGVEDQPGHKDPQKVQEFIQNVRGVNHV